MIKRIDRGCAWLLGGFGLFDKVRRADGDGWRLFLALMLMFGIGMALVLAPLWRM